MSRRTLLVLVGSAAAAVAWKAQGGVGIAQTPRPIVVTRVYTGPDGQTHLEEVDMKLNGNVSEMMKATGIQFSTRRPSTQAFHNAPRRQYVITLSGRGEVETSDGKKVELGPGSIDLVEDTTGKGHITRDLPPDGRVTVTIPLADQTPGQ